QGFCKGHDICRLCVQAVVQRIGSLGQAAPPDVQYICIESRTETFAHEAPGDCRTGNARDDDYGIALRTTIVGASITQIMLPDAIGAGTGGVSKSRHCPSPSQINWSLD